MANFTALMELFMAAQNQPPLAQPQQTTVTSEAPTIPISATLVTFVQNRMPPGYPWGIPEKFMPKGYNRDNQVSPLAQVAAAPTPPVVHITPAARNEIHYAAPPSVNVVPFVNDEVYFSIPPPSEILGVYD